MINVKAERYECTQGIGLRAYISVRGFVFGIGWKIACYAKQQFFWYRRSNKLINLQAGRLMFVVGKREVLQ